MGTYLGKCLCSSWAMFRCLEINYVKKTSKIRLTTAYPGFIYYLGGLRCYKVMKDCGLKLVKSAYC